ncbi:MAG: hypothetical protein H5U40_12575 [Polyangiaceae bacterium]|nr:hypothetical protein [Polyangiaceae bacterium]
MVQLLAVGAWFALLEQTNSNALLAQGRSNLMAATNLAKLVGISICVPLGYRTLGFPGAVMGYAASDSFKYAFSAVAARKLGLSGVRQDAFLTGWFVGAALLGNAALRAVASVTDIGAVHAITVLAVITILWLPRARGLKQPQIGMPSGDEQEAAGQATDVPPVAASGAGTDR